LTSEVSFGINATASQPHLKLLWSCFFQNHTKQAACELKTKKTSINIALLYKSDNCREEEAIAEYPSSST
jgi:hypothetical protein